MHTIIWRSLPGITEIHPTEIERKVKNLLIFSSDCIFGLDSSRKKEYNGILRVYSDRMFGGNVGVMMKDWKKEIFTIPNVLSMFRLLLIPVYVLIYLNASVPNHYFVAAAILAVSCLTDMIDGKIARHFNMISTLGKILDPIADKATQFSLIICLAMKYPILWYLVCLFVVKESFQLIAGGLNLRKGKMLKGALISGKICTTILFLSLILLVMIPELKPQIVNVIAIIDAVFMLIAFGDYAIAYFARESDFQFIKKSSED